MEGRIRYGDRLGVSSTSLWEGIAHAAGALERKKAQKRSSTTALAASRPASKAKVEAPQPAASQPINLMEQVSKA